MKTGMLGKLDRLFAFLIIFTNTWLFALPVASDRITGSTVLPVWLMPVQLVHGIYIYEILLVIYLAGMVFFRGGRISFRQYGGNNITLLIIGLSLVGVISNAVNVQPIKMVGACRLLLLAFYFLLAVQWAQRYRPTFVIGIACSGVLNIYYAFSIRWKEMGELPFLLGQNGPGGFLGISTILSAWLMLERQSWEDAVVAVGSFLVGVFAVSISYSRLSMMIACAGVVAWAVVFCQMLIHRRSRVPTFAVLVAALVAAFFAQDYIKVYAGSVSMFVKCKTLDYIVGNPVIVSRTQYFFIVGEIMAEYPLFGVGYGGFYDAAVATDSYKSKDSNKENPESGAKGESNPHNSFLYYTAANGVPGMFVCTVLFLVVIFILGGALWPQRAPGVIIWLMLFVGYTIFGLSLIHI